ncbi:hypothetical protein ADUPG1_010757, partial [Aduncisulcus paluster]
PKDTKQKKTKDKKKHNPKDGKPKYNPKHDSLTLTSASTLTSQCIIGSGGFGEVLLVKVDGIPFPCVLKKMLRVADKTVVKDCRKEFKMQLKLFNNPKCFNRIPRPLYILNLLDCDMKGVYGFLMEFCVGGSVSAFAKRWCADGKYVSVDDTADDSEPSDSSSASESDDHDRFDPMTLNPVKVCSLCVGMIECLDDVFTAKPKLVHRDVKPDNFLVRVDPKDGECTVVLADLGLVHIQDSISYSTSSKSFVSLSDSSSSSHSTQTPKTKRSICGTLVYNSYEALRGIHSQKSDAYSLGISMFSLFLCSIPFLKMPLLRGKNQVEVSKILMEMLKNNMVPPLKESPLFKSLKAIEDGLYCSVYKVLDEVFTGLTQFSVDERMSVHQARKKVQTIKHLLPKIGEGFKYPSVEDIIIEQKRKRYGFAGAITGGPMSHSEIQESIINPHGIIDDRDYDESEKESEESERYGEHETQSVSSKQNSLYQSIEKDDRDMPFYMLHRDERVGETSGSYSIIPFTDASVTDEFDSLSISLTKQSSIEYLDYLESIGLEREKEE